jgi:hypothetical protein
LNYPKRKKILNWHDLVPWFFPGSCICWLPTVLQGHQDAFLLGQWKWIWQNLIPWNLEMVFWICCWWLWLAEIKIYLHQPRFFYAASTPNWICEKQLFIVFHVFSLLFYHRYFPITFPFQSNWCPNGPNCCPNGPNSPNYYPDSPLPFQNFSFTVAYHFYLIGPSTDNKLLR